MYAVDDKLMAEIARCTVAAAHPRMVILFGSRGRGDAGPESDIDLPVVSDDSRPHAQRASDLYGVLSDIIIPMDALVYRPDEIEEWQKVPQAFVTTTMREGKVIYESCGRSALHAG